MHNRILYNIIAEHLRHIIIHTSCVMYMQVGLKYMQFSMHISPNNVIIPLPWPVFKNL